MDKLDVVLADLGKSLGIDDLAFTDDECRLEVGTGSVDVIADRKRETIVLSTLVADIPDGDRGEILAYLLDLNTGPALGGPALGVPEGSDAIVLTDQIAAAGLAPEWLGGRITSFLRSVEIARSLLAGPMPGASADDPAPSLEGASSMMRV